MQTSIRIVPRHQSISRLFVQRMRNRAGSGRTMPGDMANGLMQFPCPVLAASLITAVAGSDRFSMAAVSLRAHLLASSVWNVCPGNSSENSSIVITFMFFKCFFCIIFEFL